jgi:hypothetical protein
MSAPSEAGLMVPEENAEREDGIVTDERVKDL